MGPRSEVVEKIRTTELLLDRDFESAARKAVEQAKRRIWVMAYAWRWYVNEPQKPIQQFNTAFLQAIKRGVGTKVLVQDAGIVPMLKTYGLNVKQMPSGRILHTKAILVDNKALFIGSHNLTDRAFSTNLELSCKITDFEALAQFESYFDGFWRNVGV